MRLQASPPTMGIGLLMTCGLLIPAVLTAAASLREQFERKTDSGTVIGYRDTPILPWTDGKYRVHDVDRPCPPRVAPEADLTDAERRAGVAPADAVVLFDGAKLSGFKPIDWKVVDGALIAGNGSLATKEAFGDCELHIEWMAPNEPPRHTMSRGNSGVFFMGLYEVQIFDSHPSHAKQIYADGQAAAIYGETPPRVNVCRAPGQWQTFHILFTAPVFDGPKLVKHPTVTVHHNGVLVHENQKIMGPCAHCRIQEIAPHASKLPLTIQGHGSPVRFRNIWIRQTVGRQ